MIESMALHKAIEFAVKKHRDQTRKGSDLPYIVHPIEVMAYLIELGCSDDCVIAGLLHDTMEDTDTTYEELVCTFGKDIADLVAAETEDKSKSWIERKTHTIEKLKLLSKQKSDSEKIMICLADKLSNLKSIVSDLEKVGDNVWARFHADKDSIAWYYKSVIDATKDIDSPIRLQLIKEYKKAFGIDL